MDDAETPGARERGSVALVLREARELDWLAGLVRRMPVWILSSSHNDALAARLRARWKLDEPSDAAGSKGSLTALPVFEGDSPRAQLIRALCAIEAQDISSKSPYQRVMVHGAGLEECQSVAQQLTLFERVESVGDAVVLQRFARHAGAHSH